MSASPMSYRDLLQNWLKTEKAAGRVVDLKSDPPIGELSEHGCKAVFETLTGQRKTEPLDISEY
jgi:hypothetical protein